MERKQSPLKKLFAIRGMGQVVTVTVGLVIQNFDAALLQKRVKRFHIHPALGSQCLGLARRQGAFALRQQFLQSHAHFALSFSPRRWLRRK